MSQKTRISSLIVVVILHSIFDCFGQQRSHIQKDSLFLNHLLDTQQYKEALLFMQVLPYKSSQNLEIPYNKGFAFYNLKQLDSSAFYFEKVFKSSPNYLKSSFYEGLSLTYLDRRFSAKNAFQKVASDDSLILALRTFELSGLALLNRNFNEFDSLKKIGSDQFFAIQKQQAFLKSYQEIIQKQERKSATKAAVLSAIVPGLGKIYAGQLGQGIAGFLQNAVFGFQAIEAYKKDGLASTRTIVYGGLFSLFYIGNIWGSALSVKIKRQEFNDKTNEQIRFDMHIPIRTIFNQ